MNLPEFAVKRPVAISMIYWGILILGIISFSLLKIEMLPDMPIPKIIVETKYSNASPLEVEELVTKPLEETLSTLKGLRDITSISSEGKSIIIIEFYWQTDIDYAMLKAREKLDRTKVLLPENASRSNILSFDPSEKPIISFAITGSDDLYVLSQIGKNVLKRRFEQQSGVALAEISGKIEKEIIIDIKPEKLYQYNIDITDVSQKIRELNRTYTGGTIIDGWYKYSVLFPKNLKNVSDISNINIYNKNGVKFQLSDLGKVYEQNKLRNTIVRVNGHDAVILNIIKKSDANTVEVCREVKKSARSWNSDKLNKIKLEVLYDDSKTVLDAINSVLQAIIAGGFLAFLVLMIFLKNFKSPVTIAISMPFSIIIAFILLYFSGISLNILSMGGLAIGIGLLVDNSIIVIENIFRLQEEKIGKEIACIAGTKEVLLSITAGTLTTIAVFFPVIYLHGLSSVFFKEQALTITYALIASLFISVTLVPSLIKRSFKRMKFFPPKLSKTSLRSIPKRKSGKILKFVIMLMLQIKKILKYIIKFIIYLIKFLLNNIIYSLIKNINRFIKPIGKSNERLWLIIKQKYERSLNLALHNQYKTIFIVIIILVISLIMIRFIPRQFIPQLTPDKLNVIVKQPPGTKLNITEDRMIKIEDYLMKIAAVTNIEGFIGEEYKNIGLITFKKNAENKGYFVLSLNQDKISDIMNFKNKISDDISKLFDINISIISAGSVYESFFEFGDYPYEINIYSPDFDKLEYLNKLVQKKLITSQMYAEVKSNLQLTKPSFYIKYRDNVLRTYNISKSILAKKLQNLNFGDKVSELVLGNIIKDIIILPYRQTENKRSLSTDEFLNQKIFIKGRLFTVKKLIYLEKHKTPEDIYRRSQIRTATIFAKPLEDVKYREGLKQIDNIMQALSNYSDFRYEITGENKRIKENFSGLIFAFILAILLVYMILSIQFESYLLPFIIILTIPFTLIGVIWGLLITSISINIMSLIGLVVLVGIVVNDSIVKLDTINRLRKKGHSLIEAVKIGGSQRFRPIIMTSLTTIFGLLPLAIGFGKGSELAQPLAITVISGLITSTFLTLFVIPVIYVLIEKNR